MANFSRPTPGGPGRKPSSLYSMDEPPAFPPSLPKDRISSTQEPSALYSLDEAPTFPPSPPRDRIPSTRVPSAMSNNTNYTKDTNFTKASSKKRLDLLPNGVQAERHALTNAHAFKYDIMLKFLRQRQIEKSWVHGAYEQGVILKRAKDDFVCKPSDLASEPHGFFEQVRALNVKVAMTIKTEVIESILARSNQTYIPLEQGLRLQVLPTMQHLAECKKHHYAAFIKSTGLLVVWDDVAENVIARAESIQELLVSILWKDPEIAYDHDDDLELEKGDQTSGHDNDNAGDGDTEAILGERERKTILWMPILQGFVCILAIFAIAVGWRKIAIEIKIDHNFMRLLLLVPAPLQLWLGWFFFSTIVSCFGQMIGPVNQLTANSRFYSAVPSKRLKGVLPHVTIQCPVYKEGLWSVIDPTMSSVRDAISTYEMQGGTVNIFVNDDGMQLISPEDARERIDYYEEHNIGWVARPRHNPKPKEGDIAFIRPGKFKKASNMNYAMNASVRVEDKLRFERPTSWTQLAENDAYLTALEQVVKEDDGRTWLGGDIRMGDYILILDSDTRLPSDCLLDAVSEMEASPNVAIIQFASGVMNVTTSFFERGITFFTHLVFSAIKFAVASGDVAPFIGHNAILRWTAIQEIGFLDQGIEKWWSENTVSEDFDMALRLQATGYDLRFSTYFGGGFEEGVSLTVYDELARWEKYAYGCAELVFHPFAQWIYKGPFTKLFRSFIFSGMNLTSKMTIMAYIGTYYALGSAWILTVMNYFLIGWDSGNVDHYYLSSFDIYIAIVAVFSGLGTLSLAVLRYRSENRNFFSSLFENLTWLLLLTIFLGGISVHVSQALLCHLFGINMTWGATSKEETKTSVFREIPVILKKFKFTFIFCFAMAGTIVVFKGIGPVGKLIPYDWQITSFVAIWPLGILIGFHFLMPLILNPGLMQFSF